MNYKAMTVATYDAAAEDMTAHFQNYSDGAAIDIIEVALSHANDPKKARVVEVGCGAGKEAAELVKRVGWYQGFDPSAKLLEIAKKRVPEASFVQDDALGYVYPSDLDTVFAFASMLHLDKDDFAAACKKISAALRPGGLLCISLKEADEYKEVLQEDAFGKRMFYLYNPKLVCELAGSGFEPVFERHETVGPKSKPWFTLILKKRNGH